jgi:hypothetical protein
VTTRCEITELPADMCAHCSDAAKPKAPRRAPRPAGPTVTALYRGQCRGCGEPFSVGAQITHDPDTGGWVAECCDDTEADW